MTTQINNNALFSRWAKRKAKKMYPRGYWVVHNHLVRHLEAELLLAGAEKAPYKRYLIAPNAQDFPISYINPKTNNVVMIMTSYHKGFLDKDAYLELLGVNKE